MDFEEILFDLGDSGIYQKKLILFFLLPAAVVLPWSSMNVMLLVSTPDHWCYVPEVAISNLTIEQQRNLISPPSNPKCFMYDINYTEFLEAGIYPASNMSATRPCKDGWQYDKTNYESTAATKWNLYCKDAHFPSLVQTLHSVGGMIATPIYGYLSDRNGRKIAFFTCLFVATASGTASVLMTDFTAFVVLKAISGSQVPSLFQLPFVMVLEVIAPEMRTHMNGLVSCMWTVGLCFLPLIAYLTRDFSAFGLVTSSITVLLILYWKFVPESPRWLLSQERYAEALIILKKIGIQNGKSIDQQQLLTKIKMLGEKIKKEKEVDKVQNSSMDLLRYPRLRKTFIILTICWIANFMGYYGLQINVENLDGNELMNFFLSAVVEIPGHIVMWILMDKFGRRWSQVGCFLLTGIVCILSAAVSGIPYADITCSMIGKFLASGTFMATYQQSSELYPTVVRSLGLGTSSTIANMVLLWIPYLVYSAIYWKPLPSVVIGSVCIFAGVSASFLPETLNENLPQTISDAEEFGKNQAFFSFNRRRLSICKERAASSCSTNETKEEKDVKEREIKNAISGTN